MFKDRTFEEIRKEVIDSIDNPAAKIEGSYTGDLVSGTVLEISRLYAYMNSLYSAMFPTADSGEYLVKRCSDYGIARKAATHGTFAVTLSTTEAVTLPLGTSFSTSSSGLQFMLTNAVSISPQKTASAFVMCRQAGRVSIATNDLSLQPAIAGVSVTNSAATSGTDEETDEELYRRLKLRLSQNPGSGTAADYKRWALEVAGVGYAKVRVNNEGKIIITIASPSCGSVSSEVLESVRKNIDDKRPLGAVVSVKQSLSLVSSITATVKLYNGYDLSSVTSDFEDALKSYVGEVAFDDETDTLTIARLIHFLMDVEGVQDVIELKLNGSNSNLNIRESIPAFSVTLTIADDKI